MAQQKRHGFTLIELLVVMIIIGILAALVTPAIMSAMRRSKEFTIQKNIQDLNGAIASFKTKYGIHPIDFRYSAVIDEFVDRLSQRHQYGSATNTIFVFGNELENPYFGAIEGSPQWRDPANLDAAEGYVFLLNELSSNVEYPLGYVFDSGVRWVKDAQYQQNSFYAFKDTDLTDIDSDGWPEFTPAVGPQVPYCYFDSRSYVTPINNGVFTLGDYAYLGPGDAGFCYPYSDYVATLKAQANDATILNVFEETDSYQIISAGLDGVYGKGVGTSPGYRYSNNDDNQLTAAHRDNFVSFREGRLEVGYINN